MSWEGGGSGMLLFRGPGVLLFRGSGVLLFRGKECYDLGVRDAMSCGSGMIQEVQGCHDPGGSGCYAMIYRVRIAMTKGFCML
jgi:hypothetical protein